MLDQRRAQVFVESLIAEVNADKAAEFGVQWMSGTGNSGSAVGLLGTNFNVGGTNVFNLAAGVAAGTPTLSPGFNLALGQRRNGVLALGALARFLQADGDSNVLSTPNLLTLDNEEAKIVIGQNVPFVTGQYTANNSNSGAVNPFQTIERKDVGLTLRVKPQISENGTVKMQIFQEVSSIDTNLAQNGNAGVAHDLVFFIGQGQGRGHGDAVAGMHAHRVHILNRADDDCVIGGVAHHFHFILFPTQKALINQDLTDGGRIQAGFAKMHIILSVIRHATACAAQCEGRANDRG